MYVHKETPFHLSLFFWGGGGRSDALFFSGETRIPQDHQRERTATGVRYYMRVLPERQQKFFCMLLVVPLTPLLKQKKGVGEKNVQRGAIFRHFLFEKEENKKQKMRRESQ
jgi:hypothetical protein